MEQAEKKNDGLLSLKQWIDQFPERFPINYQKLDEEVITPSAVDSAFLGKYAQCSAYRAKGYMVFMHHFPISKPQMDHE